METAQDPASGNDKAVTAASENQSQNDKPEAAKAEAPNADAAQEPAAPAAAKPKARPVVLIPTPTRAEAPARAAASRRFGLMAASIALAAGLGGMLGAAGFATVNKLTAPAKAETIDPAAALQDLRNQLSLMRASIKSMSEAVAMSPQRAPADKALTAQVAKLAEAIEKLERSNAEPTGRIAKLTEAVERLEKKVAAAQPVAAPVTTGSVKPPVHPQHAQSQVVDGWRVHEVYNGVAVIEGQYGLMEVQAGDDVRGLGRVQTIRRQQDGRWAVVTSRGMIVSSR